MYCRIVTDQWNSLIYPIYYKVIKTFITHVVTAIVKDIGLYQGLVVGSANMFSSISCNMVNEIKV